MITCVFDGFENVIVVVVGQDYLKLRNNPGSF